MALIKPDFSEVQSAVAPGVYAARIKECESKESKKGSTYLNWKLELFGNPEINDRVIFLATPVTGKGAFRLKELYKAAMGEDLDENGQFDTDSLITREITVTLVEGKDQDGNVRSFPDVKAVAPYKH